MEQTFDGLLVLDKPGGITSRDAVDRALRWFPRRTRIGHTGTLDPLATGVLVLCLGSATRLTEYVQQMGKTYRSLFRLGQTSDTDDADGMVTPVAGAGDPGLEAIRTALTSFIGTIDQVPPAYSAAKITGQRAYDLARKGEDVELRARSVNVYGIDVLRYAYPDLEVEVHCGKGTYIRSLARDLGKALGCGAHVAALRRTRVGPFSVEEAVSLHTPAEEARQRLLPAGMALAELPRVVLPARERERLRNGQRVSVPASASGLAGPVGVFDEAGRVTAVAEVEQTGPDLRPVKVFG